MLRKIFHKLKRCETNKNKCMYKLSKQTEWEGKKCMIDFDTDKLMLLIRLHHGMIEVPGLRTEESLFDSIWMRRQADKTSAHAIKWINHLFRRSFFSIVCTRMFAIWYGFGSTCKIHIRNDICCYWLKNECHIVRWANVKKIRIKLIWINKTEWKKRRNAWHVLKFMLKVCASQTNLNFKWKYTA